MKAEERTAACFLRDTSGKADAEVEFDSDTTSELACMDVNGVGWLWIAIIGWYKIIIRQGGLEGQGRNTTAKI